MLTKSIWNYIGHWRQIYCLQRQNKLLNDTTPWIMLSRIFSSLFAHFSIYLLQEWNYLIFCKTAIHFWLP